MSEPLTWERVRADVAELLYQDPSTVDGSTDVLASGLDSVRILILVERWREAGAEINFVDLAESATLGAWWALLSAGLPEDGHA